MREITYAEAAIEAIGEEMEKDDRIFYMGEDVGRFGGSYGTTKGLWERFGDDRVKDTPMSEAAMVGYALGAAITGMRPIVEIMFVDLLCLAMDQIVNQTAKIRYMFGGKAKVPLVIRTAGGGGTGAAAQHSQSLEALVVHIPGLKVVMPSCPYDAKGLLISSINDDNPVIFIEHKLLYKNKKCIQNVPRQMYEIPLGKGDLKREGSDISITATSYMVQKSLEAAEKLSQEKGIECEVIDIRTLRPLDIDIILDSIKKTGRLLCVEEAPIFGGFMGEVSAQVSEKGFDWLDAPVARVAGRNCPVPYSLVLEQEMIPGASRIEKGILNLLNKT